jgi:hypothetical protein
MSWCGFNFTDVKVLHEFVEWFRVLPEITQGKNVFRLVKNETIIFQTSIQAIGRSKIGDASGY